MSSTFCSSFNPVNKTTLGGGTRFLFLWHPIKTIRGQDRVWTQKLLPCFPPEGAQLGCVGSVGKCVAQKLTVANDFNLTWVIYCTKWQQVHLHINEQMRCLLWQEVFGLNKQTISRLRLNVLNCNMIIAVHFRNVSSPSNNKLIQWNKQTNCVKQRSVRV